MCWSTNQASPTTHIIPTWSRLPAEVDATATDAAGFFAPVAAAWKTADNQSEYAGYTASDLMTAKGTIDDKSLSFDMTHRMALVIVNFPQSSYKFTNEPAIPDYTLISASDVAFKNRQPRQISPASYAMLVNPGSSDMNFSGTYSLNGENRNWQFTSAAVAGTANNYNIDTDKGSGQMEHLLQVGDYFLADGRLLSKDADANTVAAADVIGIVYNIDPARIGEAEKQALGGTVHGSVISTTDVTSPYELFAWCTAETNRDESEIGFEFIMGATSAETRDKADAQISGLRDLNNIREKRPDEYAAGEYEVFFYATQHGSGHKDFAALQAATTGWYVPAIGQWFDVVRNLADVPLNDEGFMGSGLPDLFAWSYIGPVLDRMNGHLDKVASSNKSTYRSNRYYYASTLPSADKWCYVMGFTNDNGAFTCSENSKTNWTYCRPVLTF